MFAAFKDMAIKEMPVEDAWKMIEEADKDKDVDDIKKVASALTLPPDNARVSR